MEDISEFNEIPFNDINWEDPKAITAVAPDSVHFARINEHIGVMFNAGSGDTRFYGSIFTIFADKQEALNEYIGSVKPSSGEMSEDQRQARRIILNYWGGTVFKEPRDILMDLDHHNVIRASCGIDMGRDIPDIEKVDDIKVLTRLGLLPEGIDNWLVVDNK
jgi:hypothetical protein